MKRIKDTFIQNLEATVPLEGLEVLEIGCGSGAKSVEIANKCNQFIGIDPDKEGIETALKRNIQNSTFMVGDACALDFPEKEFDLVIFSLSLHHIPKDKMDTAIAEARRVTKDNGYVVFLEPTEFGSFFDAEILFDACDGDERQEKLNAYEAIKNSTDLIPVSELEDKTIFEFEDEEDFIENMQPKRNLETITDFLKENNYTLDAKRRINIMKVG